MIWLKSTLVGTAVLLGFVILAAFILPVLLSAKTGQSVGVDYVQVSRSFWVRLILVSMFLAGFVCEYHRLTLTSGAGDG